MDTSLDHECASIHCVACCPRAQGYDDGFEFARKMYGTNLRFGPEPWVLITIALIVVMAVVITLQLRRKHDDRAS